VANFDMAVGVTQSALNGLIGQYFSTPPESENPFQGSKDVNITGIGEVTVSWDITEAPTLIFGKPTEADWDAALDKQGNTNRSAGNPLPTADMVQLTISKMSAYYQLAKGSKVGGDTTNVIGYVTVTFSGDEITLTPLAVTINESDFSGWDKLVFNYGFLPNLFAAVKSTVSVIHIPNLSWNGITLNTPQFVFDNDLLVAAATETTNPHLLDITGVTWPTDDMFALASKPLLNNTITGFVSSYQGKSYSDSGEKADLATWQYKAVVESITAHVSKLSPLTVVADLSVSLTAGGGLTTAGMALAALGCAMGGALLLL